MNPLGPEITAAYAGTVGRKYRCPRLTQRGTLLTDIFFSPRSAHMKSKIALLASCFGRAFALSSYPGRSVSAPSAAPVDVAKIVTLVCGRFTSNICTELRQVAADGMPTPYLAPPSGYVPVVTDFVWKAASVTPGQVAVATLHHELTSPPHDVAFSTAVATS